MIEKTTARQLARLFGFTGPRAAGVVCQGGSGSNLTSLVVARNTLYPETKAGGNAGRRFALFTSEHGHYSVEKAAITCGSKCFLLCFFFVLPPVPPAICTAYTYAYTCDMHIHIHFQRSTPPSVSKRDGNHKNKQQEQH